MLKKILGIPFNVNFWKYFGTGLVALILSTFLLWIFVDLLNLLASVMSVVTSLIIFFLKFVFYNKLRMFNQKRKNFTKYIVVWVVIAAIYAGLMLIFVDTLHFWVVIVNPIVTAFVFLFRYYLYHALGMLTPGRRFL